MKYIPRIGEILVAPPFMLGIDPLAYHFKSHMFLFTSDLTTLGNIVTQQLNAAYPAVQYTPIAARVFLGMFRYQRAESAKTPAAGWLAYTEAMIGFVVLRQKPGPPELLTYLGVVYIDDSDYNGPVKDPQSIPISLGREAYGLPKSPGQIRYLPGLHDPGKVQVEIWDVQGSSKQMVLSTAICIGPPPTQFVVQMLRRAWGRWWRPPIPDPGPRTPAEKLKILYRLLGAGPAQILETRTSELTRDKRALDISIQVPQTQQQQWAIVWPDMLWGTRLVGLKEFPDPKVQPNPPLDPGDACYMSLVETPLAEDPNSQLPPPTPVYTNQVVEFPSLLRPGFDLITAFGIQGAVARKVTVPQSDVFELQGVLVFAEPSRIDVFP